MLHVCHDFIDKPTFSPQPSIKTLLQYYVLRKNGKPPNFMVTEEQWRILQLKKTLSLVPLTYGIFGISVQYLSYWPTYVKIYLILSVKYWSGSNLYHTATKMRISCMSHIGRNMHIRVCVVQNI